MLDRHQRQRRYHHRHGLNRIGPIEVTRNRFYFLDNEGDWGSGWGYADYSDDGSDSPGANQDSRPEPPQPVTSGYVNRVGIYTVNENMEHIRKLKLV